VNSSISSASHGVTVMYLPTPCGRLARRAGSLKSPSVFLGQTLSLGGGDETPALASGVAMVEQEHQLVRLRAMAAWVATSRVRLTRR
jgi:hypothetical protein